MHPDILHHRTEFTLDEVARLIAGVDNDAPDNHRDVVSALRDLLKGVGKFQLYPAVPMSLEDTPLHTASGDYNWDSPWRHIPVRVKLLEKWFEKHNRPIPWKTTPEGSNEKSAQDGELAPSSPDSQKESSSSKKKGGYSQEALLRIIGGLTIKLLNRSNGEYLHGKTVNRSALRADITKELDLIGASTKGIATDQFNTIFQDVPLDEFVKDIDKALYPEE